LIFYSKKKSLKTYINENKNLRRFNNMKKLKRIIREVKRL